MTEPAQLSYSHGTAEQTLLGETIGANLSRIAAAFGDRDAVVDVPAGRRWTYAQLDADTDTLARGLIAAGLKAGDRVGIWAPNCAGWVLLQYATAKAGVILVNINPAYRSHELGYALRQSGVRLLVSAESFKASNYRAMVDEVRGGLPALQRVIYLGSADWDELFVVGRMPIAGGGDQLAERQAVLSFDDPINIQYTSGTTGFPKGATLSHHNILNNGYFIGEGCRYTEQDRVCIPVPFYHCFGMVLGNLACTTHGAAIVIPAAGFDPAATLRAVAAERCTSLYGVPTMFIAELALPDFASYDLSSLRTGIMAGSPCPVEVMKRVVSEMHMSEVTICYGMTETSPVSAQTRADDDMERRVSTVGRVHPYVEVKIVDPESGLTVPRGVTGEMCTRGYSVMLGYWDDPEQTSAGHRPGTLDAHRRPGRDGRGRLPEHRRPDQGHDHPGRGERLPAGDRRVPVQPPGHRGRPGHRGAGCPVRRGDLRLGEAPAWPATDRAGTPRILHRKDRPLQDPALPADHGRVPDDGHRQGAEVQDAGHLGQRARPGIRRQHQNRLTDPALTPTRPGPRTPARAIFTRSVRINRAITCPGGSDA